MTSVKMIGYRPELASAFAALNLEWIEKYFVAEKLDKEILGNPGKYIIDRGGYIYFATVQETIAGTFALLKQDEGTFELGKMAVAGSFQGKKDWQPYAAILHRRSKETEDQQADTFLEHVT